jgi:hypothetical protein
MATMCILFFGPFNPFHYSPLHLYLPPSIFNSFQYISLYLLPSQILCFSFRYILRDWIRWSLIFNFLRISISLVSIMAIVYIHTDNEEGFCHEWDVRNIDRHVWASPQCQHLLTNNKFTSYVKFIGVNSPSTIDLTW